MAVVFIEANFSGAEAISKSVDYGFEVILLTGSLKKLLNILPKNCEVLLRKATLILEIENTFNLELMTKALNATGYKLEAILTFSQPFTVITAELAKTFGLPHVNIEAVKLAKDKFAMRKRLQEKCIENVSCAIANEICDIGPIVDSIGLPCVIKPNYGQASIGVYICHCLLDLEQALIAISQDTMMPVSTTYLVEKFLEGPLYSVETLTRFGGVHEFWGISDRTILNGVIETSAAFPVFPEQSDKIIEHVKNALDALGFDLGATHTEVILTKDGPKIVEINARVGGSGHLQMLELAMDANLSVDIVNCHKGLNKNELRKPKKAACWYSLVKENSGTILSLPTLSEIKCFKNIQNVWFYREIGEKFKVNNSNFDWFLEVLSFANSADEARKYAEISINSAKSHIIIDKIK